MRPEKCPQCGESVIQTNLGHGQTDDHCEECGWPEENRIPQGSTSVTYLQLKQMLDKCRSDLEAAPGEDEPDGYSDLNEKQTEVADACWVKGMDQLSTEVLNWAFDQLQLPAAEPEFTRDLPTEQDWYWHWNGDPDCGALPTSVMMSGHGADAVPFVSHGQLGLTEAINCSEYGGWWCRMTAPKNPSEKY